jgi:type I restriction enzyme R subunit
MPRKSVYAVQESLIVQLNGMGYANVVIKDEAAMQANLKQQLESHNQIIFTQTEYEIILNYLNTRNRSERATILHSKFALKRDNGIAYISFLNADNWHLNEFQVSNLVFRQVGRKHRYEATLIVNGLPLIQIELKEHEVKLKEVFFQVNRYTHSVYDAGIGLFKYVQIFVISNRLNTKYFINTQHQSFQRTLYWTGENNKRLWNMYDFCSEFFNQCNLVETLTRFELTC